MAVAQPFAFLPPFFPPPPPPSSNAEGATAAARPPFPAFPFPLPFFFPPPPGTLSPPSTSDLTSMSEDQLRSLEGEERSRVEARIHMLRNIQTLLDSAVSQMNLYVTSTTPPAPGASAEGAAAAANESTTALPTSTSAVASDTTANTTGISTNRSVPGPLDFPRPPTAETGAIPKTAPKLPPKTEALKLPKIASSEATFKGDSNDAEKEDAKKGEADAEESGGEGVNPESGGGDADKDEANEIRRRRLQKLSVDASPASQEGDKIVEEAVE